MKIILLLFSSLCFAQQGKFQDFTCTTTEDCKNNCFDIGNPLIFSPLSCTKYAAFKKQEAKKVTEHDLNELDAGLEGEVKSNIIVKNIPYFLANMNSAVNALNKGCYMSPNAVLEDWISKFDQNKIFNVSNACIDKAETLLLYKSILGLNIASEDPYKDADDAYWHACYSTINKKDEYGFCSRWAYKFQDLSIKAVEEGDTLLIPKLYSYAYRGFRASCIDKKNNYACQEYKSIKKYVCSVCATSNHNIDKEICNSCIVTDSPTVVYNNKVETHTTMGIKSEPRKVSIIKTVSKKKTPNKGMGGELGDWSDSEDF